MSNVFYYDYGYSSYSSGGDDWIPYVIIGYAIGCIFMGFITVAIMKGKGHENAKAWFWCGFFLGLIGLIIAACQTNLNYVNSQKFTNNSVNPSARNTKTCTSCGAVNSIDSEHCVQCGYKLHTVRRNTSSWVCNCGARNTLEEQRCHRCGKPRTDSSGKPMVKSSAVSSASSPSDTPAQKSITEQLEELKKLQEQGLITETDFEAKKKQILNL